MKRPWHQQFVWAMSHVQTVSQLSLQSSYSCSFIQSKIKRHGFCNSPQTNCSCFMAEWRLRLTCLGVRVSSCQQRTFKQYLGLDAVEASEPEDLPAAQLSFSAVDLLLILCQLLSFLLARLQAKPRLLQTWQPLRWHRGDHLRATFVVSEPSRTVLVRCSQIFFIVSNLFYWQQRLQDRRLCTNSKTCQTEMHQYHSLKKLSTITYIWVLADTKY